MIFKNSSDVVMSYITKAKLEASAILVLGRTRKDVQAHLFHHHRIRNWVVFWSDFGGKVISGNHVL